MEPLNEALRLLRRQAEIANAMRGPAGIQFTAERELHEIRQTLTRYPGAVRAILETASRLRRPVDVTRLMQVCEFMHAQAGQHFQIGRENPKPTASD